MKTIAVSSGKGGVGKSSISANLAIALASSGQRVVVFDADLGLANMDLILGVNALYTLQHALDGRVTLEEALSEGPGGIRFLAGCSAISGILNISRKRLQEFLSQIVQLETSTDVMIFDTSAGIDARVMTFLRSVDQVLLVVTPDPASITDAYSTVKTLVRVRPDAEIHVVANMVNSPEQGKSIYEALSATTNEYLNTSLTYAGCVRQDKGVVECVRKRAPFIIANPKLTASQDIVALANHINGVSNSSGGRGLLQKLLGALTVKEAA